MSKNRFAPIALTLLVALALPLPAAAQPAMEGFVSIDKFIFLVAGEESRDAEIYQSQAAGAFLVIAPEFESPILVQARAATVSTVNLMKVDKQADGRVRLLEGASLAALGRFSIAGDGIEFEVDGTPVELRNKPWLLGAQDLEGMRAYSADYRRGAAAYEVSGPVVDSLKSESRSVEVKVFFGTWCPHCQQVLPRVLRVAEELVGSQVELSFYGLPQGAGFTNDALVQRFDIDAVPTGVVLVDGEEVGRISGSGWKIPEQTIQNLLQGP